MVLYNLTERNIKLFFKDKGLLIGAMITPLILIVLYATFLKNVYVDSFNKYFIQLELAVDKKLTNTFVYAWLFSSLLSVSSVTVSFASNLLLVQDKVNKTIHDINVTPVKKTTLALSYYLASMLVTLFICYFVMIIGFIIIGCNTWCFSASDVFLIILNVFLLTNFATALSSIIYHFLNSQGQMSTVSALVSSIYGFICGAYMPIASFGDVMSKILMFLPGTYATNSIRYCYERGVIEKLNNMPSMQIDVIKGIEKGFDIKLFFFNNEVPFFVSLLVLILSAIILLLVYVLLHILSFKKMKIDVSKKDN